ncbi:hypothetical protein [Streptomyces finlayi]|uniref:hypothetical protein n=1 Tax=Streptomyces finlayi TaxID=67296 RepID=UPI00167396F1|nr:hypothetical protein [Streptomyces finlayi]
MLRPDAAEQDLAAALRTQLPLHGDGVEVVGGRVQLTVDEATHTAALQAERLRQEHAREETRRHQENIRDEARRRDEHAAEEARLRREYELDSLARRQARAREDFLRREILASPASARLYTLLERSADYWPRLGGPPAGTDLSSLVREVQQWHPQESWVTVAQLLHDFVLGLSLEGRKEFLTILANAVHVHGDEKRAQLLTNALGEQE